MSYIPGEYESHADEQEQTVGFQGYRSTPPGGTSYGRGVLLDNCIRYKLAERGETRLRPIDKTRSTAWRCLTPPPTPPTTAMHAMSTAPPQPFPTPLSAHNQLPIFLDEPSPWRSADAPASLAPCPAWRGTPPRWWSVGGRRPAPGSRTRWSGCSTSSGWTCRVVSSGGERSAEKKKGVPPDGGMFVVNKKSGTARFCKVVNRSEK